MRTETVEIPAAVLSSVETLDELQDWLTGQNPVIIEELRVARKEDLAGEFKPLQPPFPRPPVRSPALSMAFTPKANS